jgi:hypothetical protein
LNRLTCRDHFLAVVLQCFATKCTVELPELLENLIFFKASQWLIFHVTIDVGG